MKKSTAFFAFILIFFSISQSRSINVAIDTSVLITYDDTDTEIRFIGEPVEIKANYSNLMLSEPIKGEGVYCKIYFNKTGEEYFLDFYSSEGVYKKEMSFPSIEAYWYSIYCDGKALGFDSLEVFDKVFIGERERCADGTLYEECGPVLPTYCSEGKIIDKCTSCGCPSGFFCSQTGSCIPGTTGGGSGPGGALPPKKEEVKIPEPQVLSNAVNLIRQNAVKNKGVLKNYSGTNYFIESNEFSLKIYSPNGVKAGTAFNAFLEVTNLAEKKITGIIAELGGEKKAFDIEARSSKNLSFDLFAPFAIGSFSLIGRVRNASISKEIILEYTPLSLETYINGVRIFKSRSTNSIPSMLSIKVKNIDSNSLSIVEVRKGGSLVFSNNVLGGTDYEALVSLLEPGEYIISAKLKKGSEIITELENRVIVIDSYSNQQDFPAIEFSLAIALAAIGLLIMKRMHDKKIKSQIKK